MPPQPADSAEKRLRTTGAGGRLLVFPSSDRALVEHVVAGERWAQELLFERYAKDVRRVLQRIMGPDADLSDLVHDAFLDAFAGIRHLQDAEALRGWLLAIAIKKAQKTLRQRIRRRRLLSLLPDVFDPGYGARQQEARHALRAAYETLDRLRVEDRIAFCLRFVDGMSLEEIASACQISRATVCRRLARGRRRFLTHAKRLPVLQPWVDSDEVADG